MKLHVPHLVAVRMRGGMAVLAAIAVLRLSLTPLVAAENESPDFERSVAPLIVQKCLECHNATQASGGLDLTNRERVTAGGDSGAAIVPGNADGSFLVERIAAGEMPPEKNGKPQSLSAEEVRLLRDWVAGGARWPAGRVLDPYEKTTAKRGGRDWWSLQPIQRPPVPAMLPGFRMANSIDAFIAEKLAAEQMTMAPPADKRALLRRVYFDLIGLPPTSAEIDAFLADQSANAYELVVDRLLESPHFGERWARHWLDVARFAETNGYERDAVKPQAWKYRDWVIDAFNTDKPFDRFVIEQLAGDELPQRDESTVVATGFIRLGTWDDEPNDSEEYQYDRLEDMAPKSSMQTWPLIVGR